MKQLRVRLEHLNPRNISRNYLAVRFVSTRQRPGETLVQTNIVRDLFALRHFTQKYTRQRLVIAIEKKFKLPKTSPIISILSN